MSQVLMVGRELGTLIVSDDRNRDGLGAGLDL